MPIPDDENSVLLRLEECLRLHAIEASLFAPFVIARCSEGRETTGVELDVHIEAENAESTRVVRVRLQWEPESAFTLPVAVQARVVTEWAALGVACAILPALTGMRVLAVALEGDRFDYRVGDGQTEWALEVSGTLTEDEREFRERLRIKLRQLHDNPFGLRGYTIVVGFVRQEVLLYLPEE